MVENTIVDETFKLTTEMKEIGAVIDWFWETEIWEGTRIGNDNYIDVRPLENQTSKLTLCRIYLQQCKLTSYFTCRYG